MTEASPLRWYQNPINWFLIVAGTGALVFFWWTNGMPGVALSDGEYSCTLGFGNNSLGAAFMHEATVVDGEVVEVRHMDMWDGAPVDFHDVERKDPSTFRVTTVEPDGDSSRQECTQ